MAEAKVNFKRQVRRVVSRIVRGKYRERLRYRMQGRQILHDKAGEALIRKTILAGEPASIGKIGDTEMITLENIYLKSKPPANWPSEEDRIYLMSGVYPPTLEFIRRWGEIYMKALSEVDILAAWATRGEEAITRRACPEALLVKLESTEPYYSNTPWSEALRGKKVLVCTSFPKTIAQQFGRRDRIWADKRVLPEFELDILEVPTYVHFLPEPKYPDWAVGLEEMCKDMDTRDFDVALIGAGAWSLGLAANAKKLGKIGIHLGGSLQVLFGVMGKRWEGHQISTYWNDAWTRPLPEETPENKERMEHGAYW